MGRKITREPLVLTDQEQKKLLRIIKKKTHTKLDKQKNYIAKILLYYSQGWSVADVARKASVSEPTAYKYIDEALEEQKGYSSGIVPIQSAIPLDNMTDFGKKELDKIQECHGLQKDIVSDAIRKKEELKKDFTIFCITFISFILVLIVSFYVFSVIK